MNEAGGGDAGRLYRFALQPSLYSMSENERNILADAMRWKSAVRQVAGEIKNC